MLNDSRSGTFACTLCHNVLYTLIKNLTTRERVTKMTSPQAGFVIITIAYIQCFIHSALNGPYQRRGCLCEPQLFCLKSCFGGNPNDLTRQFSWMIECTDCQISSQCVQNVLNNIEYGACIQWAACPIRNRPALTKNHHSYKSEKLTCK